MSQALLQRLTHKHQSLGNFRYYDILVHIFVVVLLISNLVGSKICAIGPFRISGAQLLFPITYIFGDVFTEVYGYSGSRRAIWIGFFASGLMAFMGFVTVHIPPAPDWPNQHAFEIIFNFVPRMVAASLIAFWCGEFANSYTLARMKLLTEGRWLWTRTVGSTGCGGKGNRSGRARTPRLAARAGSGGPPALSGGAAPRRSRDPSRGPRDLWSARRYARRRESM